MPGLPVDVRALYDAGKKLTEDRDRPVRIAVLVEIDAPDELVEAARAAFHPKSATGIVDVSVIEPDTMPRVDSSVDAAIVLVGSGSHVAATLKDLRGRSIPTAAVALRSGREQLSRLLGHPENDTLVGEDATDLIRGQVADWLMTRLEKLRMPLGHNFEFMRRAAAKEIVQKTAWQNAAIGAIMFIPGADMPILTLNQGKMLLQIAAAFGQPLDRERIKELGAVVAGGFLFRTFARELVGLVPGLGWAVKGGIAYSGTVAMGAAAIKYFEQGADLKGVVTSLTERATDAAAAVAGRLQRHEPIETVLDYVPATGAGEPEAGASPAVEPAQPALLEVPPAAPTLLPQDAPSAGEKRS
jgi:uncharacterized protein (DUF697 family)